MLERFYNVYRETESYFKNLDKEILIIKRTSCTNFTNLFFGIKILHFFNSSSLRHQEFFTAHTAKLYGIYRCCVYSEKLLMMDTVTVRNM